jgi:hypothetical protein
MLLTRTLRDMVLLNTYTLQVVAGRDGLHLRRLMQFRFLGVSIDWMFDLSLGPRPHRPKPDLAAASTHLGFLRNHDAKLPSGFTDWQMAQNQ